MTQKARQDERRMQVSGEGLPSVRRLTPPLIHIRRRSSAPFATALIRTRPLARVQARTKFSPRRVIPGHDVEIVFFDMATSIVYRSKNNEVVGLPYENGRLQMVTRCFDLKSGLRGRCRCSSFPTDDVGSSLPVRGLSCSRIDDSAVIVPR